MSTITLNSTGAAAMSLAVTSSWDNILECDWWLRFSHMGDGEHIGTGELNVSGICLNATRPIELQNSIRTWLDSPEFNPSGFCGSYKLAYFEDESKLTMIFDAGMDDYINANVEYQFGTFIGKCTIQTDQSCLRLFANEIQKSNRTESAG